MAGFFSPQLLDRVRILVLRSERIADPDFYPMLQGLGFKSLPTQSGMAAITLCDVVVPMKRFRTGTCFTNLFMSNNIVNSGFLVLQNFTSAAFCAAAVTKQFLWK